jgi:anti-anti-sigma factor
MHIDVIREDETLTHIALNGRMGLVGVQDIEKEFEERTVQRGKSTLIDLSAVDYVSSLGLRTFLAAARSLQQQNQTLLLFKPRETVRATIEMAGMQGLMAESENLDAALRQLQKKSA